MIGDALLWGRGACRALISVAVVAVLLPMGSSATAADPSPAPAASVPAEGATAQATDLPRWRGRWNSEGELPIEPRTGAAVALIPWTGGEAIVWGGVAADGRLLNDGVLIDTRGSQVRSRVTPAAPLSPRREFGWASQYDRVYAWGGVDAVGQPLSDGAEYGADWTLMPESPLPPGPASMAVVDDRLWVVVTDPETSTAKVASIAVPLDEYSSWGLVVDVPLPVADRYDVVGCCEWNPSDLTIVGRTSDGFATAAAWDIGSVRAVSGVGDGWTQLGEVPVPPLPAADPAVGRATEEDLAAWAGSSDAPWPGSDETGSFGVLVSLDRPSDEWSLTAPAPEGVGADPALVLSPRHLISPEAMAAYDLVAQEWLSLPPRHRSARFGPPAGATAWWDDGTLWVFGGRKPDGSMETEVWSFEPKLPKRTYALPTGEGVSLWGGEECYVVAKPGTTWRVRGDPRDPALVWLQHGRRRMSLTWPDGWQARFSPELEILDTTSTVRYREGDRCTGDTGTGG